MHRFITILLLLAFSSCASGPINKTQQNDIHMTGGHFERKSWDDTLVFKKTSWYLGATLGYDLLLTRIDKSSPFNNWLESNSKDVQNCKEFYVGLIYSYNRSLMFDLESPVYIKNQISELGFKEISIPQFRSHLAAHTVFQQWNLKRYKIAGFCFDKMSSIPKEIPISLPGFKTINVLED